MWDCEIIDPDFDDFPIPSIKEMMSIRYGDEPNFAAMSVGVPIGFGDWIRVEGEIKESLGSSYGYLPANYGGNSVKKHKSQHYTQFPQYILRNKRRINRGQKFIYYNHDDPQDRHNYMYLECVGHEWNGKEYLVQFWDRILWAAENKDCHLSIDDIPVMVS